MEVDNENKSENCDVSQGDLLNVIDDKVDSNKDVSLDVSTESCVSKQSESNNEKVSVVIDDLPTSETDKSECTKMKEDNGIEENVKLPVETSDECSTKDSSPLDSSNVSQSSISKSEVEIVDNTQESSEKDSCSNTSLQTDSCSAFTKCQDSDSGTDDSESDSDNSSDSDSSDTLTSDKSEAGKSEGSNLSEDEPEVVEKPKTRNTYGPKPGGEKPRKKKGHLYKDELDLDDLPPIDDLHITVPEEECEPLGTVYSIVNQLVVIQSLPNKPALNLDSLLFKKFGESLGQIFDVFGPVKTPFYSIRFNSRQEISDKGIEVGQTVCCAPQTPHTKYVFLHQLMQQKGSDASWKHNYEVPEALADYSDDEEERKAKRKQNQKTRERPNRRGNDQDAPQKKRPVVKSEFVPNYKRYTGNEWYRARVSELNQFNRSNRNHHNNDTQQHNFPPQQRSNFDSCGPPQGNFEQPAYSLPPPLVRPPTPNNWNAFPSNGQFGPSNNSVPGYCPPSPYCPQIQTGPRQYFPDASGQFSTPPPFSSPPPFSYERLNSSVHFTNPVPQRPERPPPPPPQWSQNGQPHLSRQTNFTQPRMFPPPLPRSNLSPNVRQNYFSPQPPPPPPPPGSQPDPPRGPPNYFNQFPQNY